MRCSRIAVLAVVLCSTTAIAQQARDVRTPTRVGTASVTGTVVSDDRDAKPLRRAQVSITGFALPLGHTTITADDGTFRFDRLPAGRYAISAAKAGYVPIALRPQTEQSTTVEVRAGQTGAVSLRLQKGAVITGTVTSPDGTPAAGVSVTPLIRRYVAATGERRTMPVPQGTAVTDDRGAYRIFGLAPGSYLVSAAPRAPTPTSVGLRLMTEAEVKRALAEVKQPLFASRPGIQTTPPPAAKTTESAPSVMMVPIFYPGSPSEARAVAVTLAAGEVRSGIDIDLEFVRAATIEGYVTVPDGARTQVILTRADTGASQGMTMAMAAADGRFTFRNVAPGHYAISSRATAAAERISATQAGMTPAESAGWGRTEVLIVGDDLAGITLSLRPPLTLSGRIVFASNEPGAQAPPIPLRRIPVPLATSGTGLPVPLPRVDVDGERFAVTGLLPVRYRFQALPQGVRSPLGRWWLTSLMVRGRELLDSEVELTESVDDAVITFADRASELSGTARYASGTPVREGHVVIFSTNPGTWFFNSRRVVALETSTGKYSVKNLPAGDYFVTVAQGLERNEWFNPEVLELLAKDAQKVTLAEFETKTFEIVLR
jgi:hypothetical protein